MSDEARKPGRPRLHAGLTVFLSVSMVAVGVYHFIDPAIFMRIVPDWLPAPRALVLVSGAFEILGGVGVLHPKTRRLASLGLIALYLAVFPANIHMAVHGIQLDPANPIPEWAMWARLPYQAVFIAWAWWVGHYDSRRPTPTKKTS